jgi:DNA-binding NarL/FixJ family response regulator
MGLGFGTRQIAEELGLSIKTIETYQSHLKEKLGLRNSRELVQSAIEWTLRNQSPPQ